MSVSGTQNILMSAESVSKTFRKGRSEVPVLRGVDFQIREGEMLAITGSSGAGKSTLLHILGTLEPPSQGKVYYGPEKKDIYRMSEKSLASFRNRSLGFIFQFHYLLPEFSAVENVMLPALIAGYGKAEAMDQAAKLLKFVGLEHRLTHRPAELSGGEQQRVAIARAVILRPKVILADEPTGNLDSGNRETVMDLLTELNQAMGLAVLMVTHDQSLAKRMHRIHVMRDGRFEK